MREQKRLQVVVDGMSDKDAIFEQVRDFLLHFFKRSRCESIGNVLRLVSRECRIRKCGVPCTMSEGRMPENSVR